MTRRSLGLLLAIVLIVLAVPIVSSAFRVLTDLRAGGSVPVYQVTSEPFTRLVHAEGNLEATQATLLTLSARIRGSVKIAWLAEDGSRVDEGEVVIRFDPTDMEKKLFDGESDRDATDSRITQTRQREDGAIRDLERDAGLASLELDWAHEFQSKDPEIFTRNQIIESEIDRDLALEKKSHADSERSLREELAGVEIDLLGIERRKAELQIEQAEVELQELEVRAPHDGVFVLRESWQGPPQVGSVVWSGNPVAEIPRLDEMEARVFVLEADAGGLAVGLSARVSLDAHPDRVFNATVKHVDALAKRRNHRVPIQYFGVVLELEATDVDVMKPGQRVQAVLTLDELDDAVTVPRQAVFHEEGRTVVYVRSSAGFEPVEVELGAAGLGRVVIESGLEDGAVVALHDPTRPLRGPDDSGADASGGPAAAGVSM